MDLFWSVYIYIYNICSLIVDCQVEISSDQHCKGETSSLRCPWKLSLYSKGAVCYCAINAQQLMRNSPTFLTLWTSTFCLWKVELFKDLSYNIFCYTVGKQTCIFCNELKIFVFTEVGVTRSSSCWHSVSYAFGVQNSISDMNSAFVICLS